MSSKWKSRLSILFSWILYISYMEWSGVIGRLSLPWILFLLYPLVMFSLASIYLIETNKEEIEE